MDIVGPFPTGPQQKKFLLIAVDYFSKWVEAEALARITEEAVIKFLWKNIVCRYGKKIQSWCQGLGMQQAFTFVAYPQANGQAEVTNREILHGLEQVITKEAAGWKSYPCVSWAS
ncbi:uncharacterized protein LOC141812738 [Curcuma longa]|uniref:uncharacterized protein LOC141812738 n=1 Tax=Curcuma longa TaxID=136217 RepID=UPI003D9EE543